MADAFSEFTNFHSGTFNDRTETDANSASRSLLTDVAKQLHFALRILSKVSSVLTAELPQDDEKRPGK
jgi:hypothetical protein